MDFGTNRNENPSHKKYTLTIRTRQPHKPKIAREYYLVHSNF